MLKNYIKTAWRSLMARKFYTVLNVSGLALAMGCGILLYAYISYHLSFDRYHRDADRTFRLVYELHLDKTEYDKGASMAMLNALKAESPQVDKAAFLISGESHIVVTGDHKKRFREEKTIAFADGKWFGIFNYHWLQGNPLMLNKPNAIVVTQSYAHKYFGDVNPMGKVLYIKNIPLTIVGVLADSPRNTDLKSEMYVSMETCASLFPDYKDWFTQWGYLSSTYNAFITLHSPGQKGAVEAAMAKMAKAHLGEDANKYYTFKLLPLQEAHFDSRYGGPIQKSMLGILTIIGVLIIVIAGINYINMMIAQQARRSVEIGTRKVLGASSGQLFMQFITESVLITISAAVFAVILAVALMPFANSLLFAGQQVAIVSYLNLSLFVLVVIAFTTVITGIYPAIMLSRVTVFEALKSKFFGVKAGFGRKVLVVLQNVVAQVLIACTIVIVIQVNFLKNTDKGFDRKMVITVPLGITTAVQKQHISQTLARLNQVKYFSFCNKPPSSDSQRGATVQFNNRKDWEKWPARFAIGDSAYCRTFGLKIIAGSNISANRATPEFLINEKMAAMLHVKNLQDVIGKSLLAGDTKGIIVGVVKDFNVKSLIEPIEPSVLLEANNLQTNLAIKLSGQYTQQTLDQLQQLYSNTFPDQVFTYQFVDDEIAKLYKSEILQQKLIWSSAILAIIISSLGLLGLVSLIVLQRTKEIGIRKVLGASISQVSLLLSADFLKMVFIAMLLATPISWWAMSSWIQNFAYRIQIHWWVFALAGGAAVIIALLTVSFQAVKAALANPVNSLRSE
jgi:putative ABC transport system permease protein